MRSDTHNQRQKKVSPTFRVIESWALFANFRPTLLFMNFILSTLTFRVMCFSKYPTSNFLNFSISTNHGTFTIFSFGPFYYYDLGKVVKCGHFSEQGFNVTHVFFSVFFSTSFSFSCKWYIFKYHIYIWTHRT